MQVNQALSRKVQVCRPDQSIRDVARMMSDADNG